MHKLSMSVAGCMIGLVLSAILVTSVGVFSLTASVLCYFIAMGLVISLSNSFTDQNHVCRPNIVGAAGLCGFLFVALFTGSFSAGIITAISAILVTKIDR